MIAFWQMHLLRDPCLDILDRAGQIAPSHTELNRNKPQTVLAVNHKSPASHRNVRDFAERHILAVWSRQQDRPDSFGCLTELWLVAHNEIVSAVALQDLRRRYPADCSLHCGINVGGH